jgi:DNA-binding NtrC family response regulator
LESGARKSAVTVLNENEGRFVSIVDDDIDITELFHQALCENIHGISVVAFNDPIIAFEHFTDNKHRYAIMISDLRMPGLNGLELLKKVKSANHIIRTILTTAYNYDEDELFQKYIKEGVIDSTIEKPVTLIRLCQRVREEFQKYELAIQKGIS